MDKLLSIIVPVYKAEKHLDRCVESILSQTYGNIELVLVDDGSPDACPAMCDSWAKRDWRVRVIHKKNNGASSARNAGLDMASGEYIGFVDADDFVEPDMYETLMKNALENNADRSGCGYFDSSRPDEISADGKITVLSDKNSIIAYSACGKHNNVWRSVYSKKAIGKIRFDESLVIAEDWLFNYEVSKNVSVQADTDKRLYHYESAPDSLMSRLNDKKIIGYPYARAHVLRGGESAFRHRPRAVVQARGHKKNTWRPCGVSRVRCFGKAKDKSDNFRLRVAAVFRPGA